MPDPDPQPASPATPPPGAATPPPADSDPLRALLRSVVEVLHRGLHELELGMSVDPPPAGGGVGSGGDKPAGPAPSPTPPAPTQPSTPQPSPPNDVGVPPDPDHPGTSVPQPPNDVGDPPDPDHPATPLPIPPDTEPDMPIATKNFAFAHARIQSDGEHVRVIKASGFTPAITTPDDKDASHCAPGEELPTISKVRPEDGKKQEPNTFAYRLTLPANHQIDKTEAVVYATGADGETVLRYRAGGYIESDRSVLVGLEVLKPDVNDDDAYKKPEFTVDVILFRVA